MLPAIGIAAAVLQPQASASADGEASHGKSWVANRLQETFAQDMDSTMVRYEQNMADRKRLLFSMLDDHSVIAEIGIGTGPNLSYMPSSARIIGIEPNKYMWPYARETANKLDVNLTLQTGTADRTGLPDASCDAVITTLLLCSVADVEAGLREVMRVLKPGGLYIFIEHVFASKSRPLLRGAQHVFTPLQRVLADGCNLDRDTGASIAKYLSNDTSQIEVESFDARFGFPDDLISLVRPHIAGFARKLG